MASLAGILAATVSFLPLASCICGSYGTDYVDKGTYCVDTRSNDFFSLGTAFRECAAEDTQGGVDPILVDPNNDDYLCSTIQTNPDDEPMISTCNLADNEVHKSQMISGNYTAVIEGLTFAYARVFSIIAGPPVEVTSTPTVIVTTITTPLRTSTSTTVSTIPTTIPASTTTVPATTDTRTSTLTPKRTTTTLTSIKTISLPVWPPRITKTTVTQTITTSCRTATRRNDPTCTIHPPKASLAAAAAYAPRGIRRHQQAPRPRAALSENFNALARRTPDLCTTTVVAPTEVTSTTTSVAPTSTITSTVVELRTETITPPPVTVQSGTAQVTVTVTLPTSMLTITKYGLTTTRVTPTYTATVTRTVKVAPSGKACLA